MHVVPHEIQDLAFYLGRMIFSQAGPAIQMSSNFLTEKTVASNPIHNRWHAIALES